LAGFFGKFLLFEAVIEQATVQSSYYLLAAVAIVGVVISLYYYFGVIRTIYWGKQQMIPEDIQISPASKAALWVCSVVIIYLGIMPERLMQAATAAVESLKF
ncbi:MAG: proton-translocating NADH-quinone oxidoreductase subunit N, partial [Verrucomicrobia bacterium]|nr:proton-translocating NADH-quinone oxidoreductase subunit N [Verrucomicrobiota bacterium]